MLPGWKRVGNRYIDPDGSEVSRRSYDNARYREAGWSSKSQYDRVRKSPEYERMRGDFASKQGVSKRILGPTSDFAARFNRFMELKELDEWEFRDPEGEAAEFLVDLGDREDDWEWEVGKTGSTDDA